MRQTARGILRRALPLAATCCLLFGCVTTEVVDLAVGGEQRELRERPDDRPRRSPRHTPLLVLALDGVDRDLLYDMLKSGELPELAKLLSSTNDAFAHAHFDQTLISTLPSSTATAWVTAFTGTPPAVHGVTGNEFFVRQARQLAAPVPTSFSDTEPVLQTYTDGYVNQLIRVPTVYDLLTDDVRIADLWQRAGSAPETEENLWVAASHIDLAAAEVELAGVVGREVILRDKLAEAEKDFDYILIDCPPSLGILTINALAAVDDVFLPLQPHFLALHGLSKLLKTIGLVNNRLNDRLALAGVHAAW